jgi:hypothetical protein
LMRIDWSVLTKVLKKSSKRTLVIDVRPLRPIISADRIFIVLRNKQKL